jgi:hypothetical protein
VVVEVGGQVVDEGEERVGLRVHGRMFAPRRRGHLIAFAKSVPRITE